MSFNFSIREAKAFHRSLEAQVTVVEGAGISLSTGAGVSQGYDYRRFDPNNPPPTPEVPLPYGYRRADSYRSPILDDLVRTANGGVPSPVAPWAEWAEWEGIITDGPIVSFPPDMPINRNPRLPTATRSEAEAMAAQTGMIALDLETDPRMAPHRVYRPPVAPPQAFLDPQAVEQMRHENMRTTEELRAADRDYVRYSEEVTLSRVAREVRLTVQAPVVSHHLDVELRIPPTRTINAGIIIDPSDIP